MLYRLYRDDIRYALVLGSLHLLTRYPLRSRSISDLFRIHVVANPNVRSPVMTFGSTTFFHIRNEDVYFVAVTKQNVHAALVFEFLYKLVNIGLAYFGKLNESTVKSNYTLLYELLDGSPCFFTNAFYLLRIPQSLLTTATPRTLRLSRSRCTFRRAESARSA